MVPGRVLIAILAIILAYYYHITYNRSSSVSKDIERDVLAAWDKIIRGPAKRYARISVGINSNVDLIVNGTALLHQLGVEPGGKKDHADMGTLNELQETFHMSLSKGAAMERYFTDPDIFLEILQAATELVDSQWAIGGNAALMAQKISKESHGTEVQLVAPIGARLRELLNPSIDIPGYSMMPDDEVHLIMEFGVGEKWGESRAPVATRLIISNDNINNHLSHMEAFFSSFIRFIPELIILSGLHLVESLPEETWKDRIARLILAMDKYVRKEVPLHLELASMADPKFVGVILDQVISKVNAIGLNEQEIAFASFAGGGPHFDLRDEKGQPPVHKITDIMVWLLKKYGRSVHRQDSKLTRIHFHCLTYHIIGTVPGVWFNLKSAVAMGAKTAGRQACDTETLDPSNITLQLPRSFKLSSHPDLPEAVFNASQPVIEFEVQGYKFYLSPVLVCDSPLKTVGLGDAISSMALLYSYYGPPS